MKIIQFVGFKKSGKTTLLEKVLESLSQKGYKVGTIKHHGHADAFEKPAATDGERFYNKGAKGSTIFSPLEGIAYLSTDFTVYDIIKLYESKGFDYTLIEGFKELPFPKIVLARHEQDFPQVSEGLAYLRGDNRRVETILDLLEGK